jgi:hypothetical protein
VSVSGYRVGEKTHFGRWSGERWRNQRLLLLVDGLDERATEDAGQMAGKMLQVQVKTQGIRVIATTRPYGEIAVSGPDWQVAEIPGLTSAQKAELCRKWFLLKARTDHPEAQPQQSMVEQQSLAFHDELAGSHECLSSPHVRSRRAHHFKFCRRLCC